MESLTRPFFHHRRKLSNLNGTSNGMSFSGKDAYDDVLLGAPKTKLGYGGSKGGVVAVEDYAEIFGGGGGRGGGGGTVKRGSSIPVLDLSELDKSNGLYDSRRFKGKMDYSKIFGNFTADVDEDVGLGVPPYEELLGGVKKAKCDKAKARTPADNRSPPKGPECFNSSENSRGFSSEASDQFLDGGKQLNMSYHKTNQRTEDSLNGTTHIAQLHAVPGFTYFIDEATRPQKIEHDKLFPQLKTDAIHSRSSSGDLSEGKSSRRGRWQLPDRQASEGVANGKDGSGRGEFDFKPYASNVPTPASSSANSNDNQGHPKRVKSSSFAPKDEVSDKDTNGYLSHSSDEELDVNSAAAASAAALKKAIQQAQESIRLAKELMERKKDPVQNSKSHINGSFKVRDKKEIKYDHGTSGFRKNNTEEGGKTISSEVQAFGGFDQKIAKGSDEVALSFAFKENPSIDKKVDTERHKQSAAVTEEQGVGTWFSQLLNNGKNKMAALASQLVDNRNTIFQPTSKHMHEADETISAKDTVERGNTDPGDIKPKLDALGKVPDMEKNLDKSVSEQFGQVGPGSITLMSAQEDQTTNIDQDFHHQEKCEKKLQDGEKTTYNEYPEHEMLENGSPVKELRSIVEMKEEEESFELEIRRQLDNVLIRPENENGLDEKENWRTQEDSCQHKGNEDRPEEDTAIESSEKKNENTQDKDFSSNRFKGYCQQDIDEQWSTCSLDKVENKNMSEEENLYDDIDQRPTFQHEGTENIDASADNSAESENIEVKLEVLERYDAEGESDVSKQDLRSGLFPEAANEEILNPFNNDESTLSVRTSEASEVNNTSKQTRQLEVTVLEEDDDQIGAKGLLENREENGHAEFEEDKEESEQSVEEALLIKENKMSETSSLDQICSEEHVLESIIQDVSETLASYDNAKDFGFDTTTHGQRPSSDTGLLKTTMLNTEEHDVEKEDTVEAPTVGEKTSDGEFVDMNELSETEESDEEYELSARHENWEGLFHESGGDAENIKVDIDCGREVEKCNFDLDHKEKVEKKLEPESPQFPSETKESQEHLEIDRGMKADQSMESSEDICKTSVKEDKENREGVQKEVKEKDFIKNIEVDQREREREKDRIAVERAIREARERAFADARERAERAAVEKANAEVRQRAMAGAREKLEKVSAGSKASTEKATTVAKLRAERAAVERATAEARERALEKALSQKCTSETRSQVEKVASGNSSAASRDAGLKHSFSSSDLEGTHTESAQRRKARLERHQRIMERAAKALAEKNMRDILAQREQAERNRLAETLDAEIKRWASGKEGNLRALLSTLQYILGSDSGWQAISLTEIITTNAVKKAYRKATLYVHPDKLQQRGASIQQKYICEKVFDLLKAAWNKFNSEER